MRNLLNFTLSLLFTFAVVIGIEFASGQSSASIPYAGLPRAIDMPAEDAYLVTPSDSTDLPTVTRAFTVQTTAGDVKVTTLKGTTLVYPSVQVGQQVTLRCTRIWSTGTTAAGIVALP